MSSNNRNPITSLELFELRIEQEKERWAAYTELEQSVKLEILSEEGGSPEFIDWYLDVMLGGPLRPELFPDPI